VLFLGRITMQKGPEYFLAAAKKVLEVMDNVKFVMAGSGSDCEAASEGEGARVWREISDDRLFLLTLPN